VSVMSAPALVETDGLRLTAGPRVLIDGLTIAVREGEVWAVIGRNGAGKSTLLNALAGLHPPTAGAVRVAGHALSHYTPLSLARLRGLLPQTLHDAFASTCLAGVLLGRHPWLGRRRWENDEDVAHARAALDAVGLAGFENRDVTSLSGGERQRVAIAQLLVQDPAVLLLDEPTAHLDLHQQGAILARLAGLAAARGKAIVLATHDLNLVARFASHAMLLTPPEGSRHGLVGEVLTEAWLSEAFAHPIRRIESAAGAVFVPAW